MLFSVSVDLDGLGCYAAIHGLEARALPERALRAVPEVALSRLCELFAGLGLRATIFAIGAELSLPGAAAALRRAADAGHEIGSHSHAHDYAMSRLERPLIDADLARAEKAIEAAAGARPRAGALGGHFNLELHGIDALDGSDATPELAALQPGLRLAASEKLRRLRGLLQALTARGESATLEEAAQRLLPRA